MSPRKSSLQGFSFVELLTCICVLVGLAALVFPMVAKTRESGQEAQCISRLRAFGNAIALFAADHDMCLPTNGAKDPFSGGYGRAWFLVGPYLDPGKTTQEEIRPLKMLHCPVWDREKNIQSFMYTYSTQIGCNDGQGNLSNNLPTPVRMASVRRPNTTPIVWETAGADTGEGIFKATPKAAEFGYDGPTSMNGINPNHGRKAGMLFVSGHVELVDLSRFDAFPWYGKSPGTYGKNTYFDPFYAGK